ncbi:hypothetical protein [Alkalibacillus haloalkaliphilus]|uniref:hypothetical protein n=1 Tax=Alkalibacillus haloalkaliphilus TaxID=94136 RepID=UPI002936A315|nr:hypothetical protein [Alkalibacillus haloalkaliphilus]MDV2581685.1 hypothetical protein [Alkalibacillus haloalkaliphilus]
MEEIIKNLYLTSEQRKAIAKGIFEGKEEYNMRCSSIGQTITSKYKSGLLYDLVNTSVAQELNSNPHLNLEIYSKYAGFHPYIVLHEKRRNLFVLVLKLPYNKEIFNPSGYRGDFALSNVDRLLEMGVQLEDFADDYSHQYSLPLGIDNQPFGVIVSYDGYKDVIFEGALRPDQQEWLYKEEITEHLYLNTNNVTHLENSYEENEVKLSLKKPKDEEEIKLKLKNK